MEKNSTIFITGATGFIGTHLVQRLLQDGFRIRCISRNEPKLPPGWTAPIETLWKHPNFERLNGNILDRNSISNAMNGCQYVFHLAGYAKNYSKDPTIYQRTNVDAVRTVFEVAQEQKIEKIVWTSSIVTLGPTRPGEVGDETMPRTTEKYYTEYEESKSTAEKMAFQMAANGLPLVIVNPTRVYGPGQLSEGNALGALINDYSRGRVPFLPNRGINVGNYVLVDDVAEGHYLAMQRGRIGERYILGSENASLKELFLLIDKITGKKHIKIKLLKPGPMIFARFLLAWAKITGTYPRITPGWMASFMDDAAFSCEKAKKELEYNPVPLEDGLRRTLEWLKSIKMK